MKLEEVQHSNTEAQKKPGVFQLLAKANQRTPADQREREREKQTETERQRQRQRDQHTHTDTHPPTQTPSQTHTHTPTPTPTHKHDALWLGALKCNIFARLS